MGLAPENSLESIKVARGLRVDGIEVDVRLTKDSKLAVFHDATLKRLADKTDKISLRTMSELQKIKLSSGSYIPSLSEVIQAAGDTTLLIEGKAKGWARPLANTLRRQAERARFEVLSFDHDELLSFHKLCPDVQTYGLATFNLRSTLKNARKNGFNGIDVYFVFLPFTYTVARKKGLKVIAFGINSRWLAGLISYFFPEVEITTNAPHKLLKLVKTLSS